MAVIEMKKVTKQFGKLRALDGVDLVVKQGEVMGFLGPNGAGKSTSIRILLGLLRKNGGDIRLFDSDPWDDAVTLHRKLVYVPGDVNLWPNLTGGEVIDLLGKARGGLNSQRREELVERFQFDPTKKCSTYSKGNRQKVALITAFAAESELYILDEPTSGLDPLMAAEFQRCVLEVKTAGKTVLLSSHILAEVEALCDRISIIKEGRIIESGTLNELRHLTRTSLTVETLQPMQGLNELSSVHNLVINENTAKFQVDTEQLHQTLEHVMRFGILSLTSTPPTLEEMFMRHYGSEAR